jgi:hypothetical protein
LYEKLLNWKETDPKQYWQVLNSLKKGDNSSKNPEIQVKFENIIEHFKSQGKNYNVNLKNKVENHIIQYKNLLTENSNTDKPFTISEIKQCINILKSNKSAGPDLIANEIIKCSVASEVIQFNTRFWKIPICMEKIIHYPYAQVRGYK